MIVTSIRLYSNGFQVAEFGLDRPGLSQPYLIKAATGLDADEIIPRFYAIGNQNAQGIKPKYYDMALNARDIVLKVSLNPQFDQGQTYSFLRDSLYKAISAYRASEVQIQFLTGTTVSAVISGFITKVESPQFVQNPDVTITIRCQDPYFKAPAPVLVTTTSINKSIPTITDNISTAPHGFKMRLTFSANVNGFEFSAYAGEWAFDIGYSFLAGDQLWFSSDINDKYLYVVRSGVTTNLVDKLILSSVWPFLFPGANNFSTSSVQYTFNSVSYYPTFWGI